MAPTTATKKKPPATPASTSKITSSTPASSATKQKSIVSFFKPTPSAKKPPPRNDNNDDGDAATDALAHKVERSRLTDVTPLPSSDPVGPEDGDTPTTFGKKKAPLRVLSNANGVLPSPAGGDKAMASSPVALASSPLARSGRKTVNYGEMSEDEEDEIPKSSARRKLTRATKKQKMVVSDDDDDDDSFKSLPDEDDYAEDDDSMDDFVVDDDSDSPRNKKRKRTGGGGGGGGSRSKARKSSPITRSSPVPEYKSANGSTAARFAYVAGGASKGDRTSSTAQSSSRTRAPMRDETSTGPVSKGKKGGDDERYPWLVDVRDKDGNKPGHPDYDPRTLYIPPYAWNKFSPFEKQYWEIKQNLFDTVVFFKKGKFYELYENDATIGHQQFDLKLTDRVNMRMVGVPEMSLPMWSSQFIGKGYKVARVAQVETALGKEMRERDGGSKADKIIRRELECVLTAGTLIDESMLQNDMSTYCVAIKESVENGIPSFGICFVDTATGAFSLAGWVDDPDATKFETMIAQIRPKELVLERGCLSTKSLRILKTNTDLTTIWTWLKPGTEFLTDHLAQRELDIGQYYEGDIPEVLNECLEKELVMSAFGGLLWYLKSLKIDKDLISLGNFSWYDPIRKSTSLVLDGQTLQNLEIFANSFDGGAQGTLFALLNWCITPFGKRTFRQWLCHPLSDAKKIDARLDAVEAIMADDQFLSTFTGQLNKLPDLERMISRIHAGNCTPKDFLRVLDGFEQINYTISQLAQYGAEGEGVIAQLIQNMPDIDSLIKPWASAFDRKKARDENLLIPERGVDDDFDKSQDNMEDLENQLDGLMDGYRKEYRTAKLRYCDSGKEIYLVEAPTNIKNIPKSWAQMGATKQVKRYYPPAVKALVQELLEARETHAQIVKGVLDRFCQRFDENYSDWLRAVNVIAQLDCLISLARASKNLGEPACRPEFVESERSVLDFQELRHPCMLPSVGDFIPNDIHLGGENSKITLLTGANAAGKSTVLRMTCVGVIMAQIGCYVPAVAARLTPVDRIMSRLGANDNIFAAQSTFFVELSETKKILSEATPRSLVILDELGRGTSSYDGVAIAQSVLHHVATHIGCVGFFATHYGSLATEFEKHPEVQPRRMRIRVDDAEKNVTFMYKLEPGVAEKSFGMYCAAMCGIQRSIIDKAEDAAKEFEHTSRLKDSLEAARQGAYVPLGLQSDFAWLMKKAGEFQMSAEEKEEEEEKMQAGGGDMDLMAMNVILRAVAAL